MYYSNTGFNTQTFAGQAGLKVLSVQLMPTRAYHTNSLPSPYISKLEKQSKTWRVASFDDRGINKKKQEAHEGLNRSTG